MNGFDADQLIDDIATARTPEERFAALTGALLQLGLNTINYGFFDLRAAAIMEADIQFLSTMSEGWMSHYFDRNLPATDIHVLRVRAGKITPYIWGDSPIQRLELGRLQTTALEAAEAGLRSSLCVPFAGPMDPFSPVAAINLGSSLPEQEFQKVRSEHGVALTTIAHVFHNASIRQIWSDQAGRKALSVRERGLPAVPGRRPAAGRHCSHYGVSTGDGRTLLAQCPQEAWRAHARRGRRKSLGARRNYSRLS